MSPEQVVLEYVQLDKDSFFDQVEVSDEDLKPLYESEIANLAEQRQAAHILIEGDDEAAVSYTHLDVYKRQVLARCR